MTREEMNKELNKLEREGATRGMVFTTDMGLTHSHKETVLEHSKFIIRRAFYILNAPDIDIFEALEKQWCIMLRNPNTLNGSIVGLRRARKIMEEENEIKSKTN